MGARLLEIKEELQHHIQRAAGSVVPTWVSTLVHGSSVLARTLRTPLGYDLSVGCRWCWCISTRQFPRVEYRKHPQLEPEDLQWGLGFANG